MQRFLLMVGALPIPTLNGGTDNVVNSRFGHVETDCTWQSRPGCPRSLGELIKLESFWGTATQWRRFGGTSGLVMTALTSPEAAQDEDHQITK